MTDLTSVPTWSRQWGGCYNGQSSMVPLAHHLPNVWWSPVIVSEKISQSCWALKGGHDTSGAEKCYGRDALGNALNEFIPGDDRSSKFSEDLISTDFLTCYVARSCFLKVNASRTAGKPLLSAFSQTTENVKTQVTNKQCSHLHTPVCLLLMD